jgi:hypothetical protein
MRLCESIVGPTFEIPARICAYVAAECEKNGIPRSEVLLGLDDLFASFRRVPSSQSEFSIVALYEFDSDRVRFHEVFGMNFGLKAAPLQFNRVAELLCEVASCFGGLPVDHPPITTIPVEPKKRKDTDTENGILGVHVDLWCFQSEGIITFRPTEKRVLEILQDLWAFQEQGSLEPTEAASLQGRLSFTLSTAYVISSKTVECGSGSITVWSCPGQFTVMLECLI